MTIAESYTISVIKPKTATSLVTNPSFELGTTGWTTGGTNTIAQSSEQQRRGAFSCKATYQNNQILISGATTLTAAAYVGSVDIYIPSAYNGSDLRLGFQNFTGAVGVQTDINMTIRDQWQRVECTITPLVGDLAGSILIYDNGTAPTAGRYIYIDGVQIELGTVATTYFDGDMTGFIRNKQDYYWTGAEHASSSVRTKDAANGGELVNLGDYCKNINTYGLGIGPIQNVSIPLTKGGERFLYQQRLARYFDIEMNFKGVSGSTAQLGNLQKNRNDVINLLKPDRTAYDQPMVLRYQGYNSSGNPIGNPVDIKCQYVDGLNQAPLNRFADRTRVTFRMSDKDFEADGNQGVELGYQTAVSNANYIIKRDVNGAWSKLGTSGLNASVSKIIEGTDGKIYIGGSFTNAGGSGANYLTVFDPAANVFSTIGTSPNAAITDLIFDAEGNLIVTGSFTTIGGVSINRIAKWNGSTWSAYGTGLNNFGRILLIDTQGRLWVGGNFATANGVTVNNITYWNGTTFVAIGTGANTQVRGIAESSSGEFFVVGDFSTLNSVSCAYIGKIGSNLSTVTNIGNANAPATSVKINKKNEVWVTGTFTTINSLSIPYFAIYNGSSWSNGNITLNNSAWSIYFDEQTNEKFIAGQFSKINGISIPDGMVEFLPSGGFSPLEADLPSSAIILTFLKTTKVGVLFVGYDTSGTAYSATVTTPEIEGATTYPIIKVTGPGILWQIKNYTTGRAIYFNGLTLLAGEKIIIDLTPGKVTMQSTFRGSILSYVIKGSNLDFPLTPGENNLSAYLYGSTTAASKITATWKKRLHYLGDAT